MNHGKRWEGSARCRPHISRSLWIGRVTSRWRHRSTDASGHGDSPTEPCVSHVFGPCWWTDVQTPPLTSARALPCRGLVVPGQETPPPWHSAPPWTSSPVSVCRDGSASVSPRASWVGLLSEVSGEARGQRSKVTPGISGETGQERKIPKISDLRKLILFFTERTWSEVKRSVSSLALNRSAQSERLNNVDNAEVILTEHLEMYI